MKLVDHTVVSIIISIQFLASIFYLLSYPFMFLYGGGSPGILLLWIAYWGAGIVTAVLLQKAAFLQKTETWRRLPAMLWNSLWAFYFMFRGAVNWRNPFDNFDSYSTLYCMFAVVYLAATSAIGFGAGRAVASLKEKKQRAT
jgi:hypothetical protein